MRSIRMLKLSGKSIFKPPNLIFQSCMKQGKFPTEWIKADIVPVHKKGDKQILKHYLPVSLLLICGKIFDRLICNNVFEYFVENDLISQNQSGFKPVDSYVNQLISITLTTDLKSGKFFLTYPKLLIKFGNLKQNGVTCKLQDTLTNYLNDRKKVVLNNKHSKWTNDEAGVLLGSVLGPLFFFLI